MMLIHSTVIAVVLAATAAGLAACNTIEGLGKDVEAAGGAIAGAADEDEDDDE